MQTRPSTAAVRRPASAWTRPGTATARPGSSTPRSASSSMDSVTFESERQRMHAFDEHQSVATSASPPITSRTTVADTTTVLTIDDENDDYEQVT